MEQFNKALSFILGLVVVAVFIIVASGKFNLKGVSLPKSKITAQVTPQATPKATPKPTAKPWFSFLSRPTSIPTPIPTTKPKITQKTIIYPTNSSGLVNRTTQPQNQIDPNYHSYSGSNIPTSIPNTGVPIVLFPLFGTSLLTGIFMRKTGKKE